MLFSSMIFLWVFLPVVLISNFVLTALRLKNLQVKIKLKNYFLLAASLLFYAWGGIYYLGIMLFSIMLNFYGGIAVGRKWRTAKKNRCMLIIIIAANIMLLFFFKYFNMLVILIESLIQKIQNKDISLFHVMFRMEGTGVLGIPEIVLPIGISFFTFQAMSYVIDVYKKKAEVQSNIFTFALYVSFFPQLIAGPIVKYSDIEEQLRDRKETLSLFVSGQKRFCYGLGKKVLIANTFAQIADEVWALDIVHLGAPLAWFGLVAYTLQIYYDFSGYSDMAIGIGRMLGFQFKENFDYPYTSLSIQEFWRRWHMSLSAWFKEYVYIPLGGNRGGEKRTYRNVFLVFLLTGIWHGANFTFILWGVFYALLQIAERVFLKKLLDKNPIKLLNWFYMIFCVMIAWVFFRADSIFQAADYIGQMFCLGKSKYSLLSYLSMEVILCLSAGILFSGFVQRLLEKRYEAVKEQLWVRSLDLVFQAVILVFSISMMVSGTYNPFIYFQF